MQNGVPALEARRLPADVGAHEQPHPEPDGRANGDAHAEPDAKPDAGTDAKPDACANTCHVFRWIVRKDRCQVRAMQDSVLPATRRRVCPARLWRQEPGRMQAVPCRAEQLPHEPRPCA